MKSILRGVVTVLVLWAPIAQAGEAKDQLDRFLSGLSTLRAEFRQTVLSQDNSGEESSGELFISRPGKFRLQYVKPYEQLYVADGKRVWLYDKDLAQVTVKNQQAALGSTPALLLSSTEPLTNSFKLAEAGERDGMVWIELRPLAEESSFESVSLGLSGGALKVMDMLDGLGQRTRIEFVRMDRNVKIDPTKFRFVPPAGVDVVGE